MNRTRSEPVELTERCVSLGVLAGMTREFDHIAKQLWFLDQDTVRFVTGLPDEDRRSIEQALFSLYGATVHLTGTEIEIRKVLEKARR